MVNYPRDWSSKRLLDRVTLISGLTYTPERVKKYGTLVLRSSNIQNQSLTLDDNVYVDMNVPPEKMVQEGDILVCVRNGSASLIGKNCVLPRMEHTTFGAFMAVLRGDKTGFLAYLFASDMIQKQLKNRSSATINQITKKDFGEVKVVVPASEAEQTDIAKTLRTFQNYEEGLGRLIEKKKGIRDGALEELMSGKKRLDGFSGVWKQQRIGDILCILHGKQQHEVECRNGKYPILGTGGVIGRTDSFLCDWACALIGRKGTIDRPMYMETPFWSIDTLYYSRPLDGQNAKFQYYLFCTIPWKAHAESSGRPSLSKKDIEATPVNVPCLAEQEAIVQVLSAMDAEIAALEAEREKVCAIRAGAMEDLLTGRIRLKD